MKESRGIDYFSTVLFYPVRPWYFNNPQVSSIRVQLPGLAATLDSSKNFWRMKNGS